jgi:hypothetical protein
VNVKHILAIVAFACGVILGVLGLTRYAVAAVSAGLLVEAL